VGSLNHLFPSLSRRVAPSRFLVGCVLNAIKANCLLNFYCWPQLAVDLAKRGVKKTEIEAVKEWEEPEVTFGSCSSHCGFI